MRILQRKKIEVENKGEASTLILFLQGESTQWLEVRCELCGLLARGETHENDAAEKEQRLHTDLYPNHRVNVEFFSRCVTSTRINNVEEDPRS